jgi:hypothetical protein
MPTIRELAQQMSEAFTRDTRVNGDEFCYLKDGSPEWMKDVCHKAHDNGEIGPDDWRYKFIETSVGILAEAEDSDEAIDQLEASVYTGQLTGWLHSRISRTHWMDKASEDYGKFENIFAHLQTAQHMEMEETYIQVYGALQDLANDLND